MGEIPLPLHSSCTWITWIPPSSRTAAIYCLVIWRWLTWRSSTRVRLHRHAGAAPLFPPSCLSAVPFPALLEHQAGDYISPDSQCPECYVSDAHTGALSPDLRQCVHVIFIADPQICFVQAARSRAIVRAVFWTDSAASDLALVTSVGLELYSYAPRHHLHLVYSLYSRSMR